jgi:hypothetical protein
MLSRETLELRVSEPAELSALQRHLTSGTQLRVYRTSTGIADGTLGSSDMLVVAAVSGTLVTALQIIPAFLRARRKNLSIAARYRDQSVTICIENIEDVMPILEKILDG